MQNQRSQNSMIPLLSLSPATGYTELSLGKKNCLKLNYDHKNEHYLHDCNIID